MIPRLPRVSPLAHPSPLELFPPSLEDGLIVNFLTQPIDSRWGDSRRGPAESKPEPRRKRPATVANHVVFDWDASIRKISNKVAGGQPQTRRAPIPDIARREMERDRDELRRRRYRLEPKGEMPHGTSAVLARLNQILKG
jgi:hypothetical protein